MELSTDQVYVTLGNDEDHKSLRKINLHMITWNAGNAEVNPKQFQYLLPNNCKDMDLIVIGLQESTYTIGADPNIEPTAPVNNNISDDNNTNNTNNDTLTNSLMPCIAHLKSLLTDYIGSEFTLIAHNKRAQMQLYIFARNYLLPYITNLEMTAENTGFLHVFPNKGGISVCFNIDDTPLAFFSSHLAAHEGVFNCYMRNDSVKEILGGTKAGLNTDLDIQSQFHHVFFMGDMNYRLTMDNDEPNETYAATKKALIESKQKEKEEKDAKKKESESSKISPLSTREKEDEDGKIEELSDDKKEKRKKIHDELLNYIKDGNWNKLLEYDELLREVNKGRLLPKFIPCPIAFPPTFKRYRGSKKDPKLGGDISRCIIKDNNKYLLSPPSMTILNDNVNISNCVDYYYNPQRYPAFTDRILYHSFKGFQEDLIFKNFDSIELVDTSDHKPVCAKFEIYTREIKKNLNVVMSGNKVKSLGLKLTNLKCKDLSELDLEVFGGGSDPYIILSTDPIDLIYPSKSSIIKSTCISHNLNPVWDKNEYLQIEFLCNDINNLSNNAHLLVQLWDKDNITEDDLIGVAVIPLKDIFHKLSLSNNNNNTIHHFGRNKENHNIHLIEELYYSGQKQGIFECDISIIHETSTLDRMPSLNNLMVDRSMSLSDYLKQKSFHNSNTDCCCCCVT